MISKFNISSDTVVLTSTYVVRERMPILFVSHELDEDEVTWQFHCGNGDYDMSKMLLVSLKNILDIDPTILTVANLPLNAVARRKHIGGEWDYSKC